MIRYFYLYVFIFLTHLPSDASVVVAATEHQEFDVVLAELYIDIQQRTTRFKKEIAPLEQKFNDTNRALKKAVTSNEKLESLIAMEEIREHIKKMTNLYISDISKIRYLKGLQIIKILYEKTLALDHHFATVSTLNEINKISNPNEYEDFRVVKSLLKNKNDKKSGFNLSQLLGNNIYTSVVHSFIALFTNNETSKSEKETNLKNVECILDFTLRMHNDLNTIYFETAFLQRSNETVITELEQLFKDYTQPITYKTPLKECRENDEWSIIQQNLNDYLDVLNNETNSGQSPSKIRNMQINLQFPIDRLLQFITQYNAFIDQGSKFYEKFGIMLNSYENEQQCMSKIPITYQTMKKNISLSIEKFNTAYKPIEINGSKLKQLLYGINEYE